MARQEAYGVDSGEEGDLGSEDECGDKDWLEIEDPWQEVVDVDWSRTRDTEIDPDGTEDKEPSALKGRVKGLGIEMS